MRTEFPIQKLSDIFPFKRDTKFSVWEQIAFNKLRDLHTITEVKVPNLLSPSDKQHTVRFMREVRAMTNIKFSKDNDYFYVSLFDDRYLQGGAKMKWLRVYDSVNEAVQGETKKMNKEIKYQANVVSAIPEGIQTQRTGMYDKIYHNISQMAFRDVLELKFETKRERDNAALSIRSYFKNPKRRSIRTTNRNMHGSFNVYVEIL